MCVVVVVSSAFGIIRYGPVAECREIAFESDLDVHASCYIALGVCSSHSVRDDENKVPVTGPKMLLVDLIGAPYTSEYLASRGLVKPFAKELPADSTKSLT